MLCSLLLATQLAAVAAAPSWIWIEGEGPPRWAPAKSRFFRRTFELEAVPERVTLAITADDEFEAFLNGARVGSGDSWNWVCRFQIGGLLRAGKNTLAVRARSTLPGPGALVARLEGLPHEIVTDHAFRVTRQEPAPGWTETEFDDTEWHPALVLGPVGMRPWGKGIQSQFDPPNLIEEIVSTYRADDPVLVVPTPRGRLGNVRNVELSKADAPVRLELHGVPKDAYAVELLERTLSALGCKIAPDAAPSRLHLTLRLDLALEEQGYDLVITPATGALLRAASATGLAYGAATLAQLLRVQDGRLVAPEADLEDFPACKVRGPVTVPPSPDWLDFCAFFKLNTWFISGAGPAHLAAEAQRRGIDLMLARHLPDDFDFQSDAALDDIAQWALSAAEAGYRWVSVNADDRPEKVFTEADRERFGSGLVGLGNAHAHFISRLKERLGANIELVFCPRVYYGVPAVPETPRAIDERAYLDNLSKGLEEPLTCWITQVTPEFLRESARRFRAPPLAWHNFFPGDTTDWKVYFEAYPIVREPQSARGFCVLGNTRDPDLWRANYVTFAGNTWNPGAPIGLREAFTTLYGTKAGAALTDYAVLAGGHDRPIGVMADFWDQPEQCAARFLSSGWAGVLPKAKPTQELLDRCLALSESAGRAVELPLVEAGVPGEMAQRLRGEARRTSLAFALWAQRLAGQLDLPLPAGDSAELRKQLRELLTEMGAHAKAGDWTLTKDPL